MDHELSEKEIIKMLAGHFNFEVKRGILSAAYQTVDDVEQHLRELDEMLEQSGRSMNQANWRQNNISNNNNNFQNNRGQNNRPVTQNSVNNGARSRESAVDHGESANDNRDPRIPSNRVVATLFNKNSDFVLEEESKLGTNKEKVMPVVDGMIEDVSSSLLIDSGSRLSCISQKCYRVLKEKGHNLPVLPTNNITIVGAQQGKQQIAKEQIFLEIKIQDVEFECVGVIVPTLSKNIILGCDWLTDHRVTICFDALSIKGWFRGKECDMKFVKGVVERNSWELDRGTEVCDLERMERYEEEEVKEDNERVECFGEKEKRHLSKLCEEFKGIFSERPGQIKGYEHKIELKDTSSFYIRPYPIPIVYRKEVQRQIEGKLA